MKRLVFLLMSIVLIVGSSEAPLYACGAKFLVSSPSGPGLWRVIENTQPTTVLIYWKQDERTLPEDRWSPRGSEYLEAVGHTVTVALDENSFLAAARDGDFKVVLIKPADEALRLQDAIMLVSPDSVVVPVLYLATRDEEKAAKRAFDRFLTLPTNKEDFLYEVDDAGRSR